MGFRINVDNKPKVKQLTRDILDEVFKALGCQEASWQRKWLWPAFWLPADRFARLAAGFDQVVGRAGLGEAARWLLRRYTRGTQVRGVENIPRSGPLLIASNHPGAFDGLVILAHLPRQDVKMIASGVPFIRSLSAMKENLIYSTADPHVRMAALRSALRYLQDGGCLLLFASGLVDPDPAFLPGAQEALERWSGSLNIFLRKAPATQLVISIASGVLAPECMRYPWIRRGKLEDWRRQRMAEYFQVMQQLVFRRKFGLTPRVSFGKPLAVEALMTEAGQPNVRDKILDYAQEALAAHVQWIRSEAGATN